MQAEATIPGSRSESEPIPSRRTRVARLVSPLLVPFGLLALAIAVVMVVGLHLLPDWGGVDPITGMLSDYGIRPQAWVFDTALDILSLGSAAVLVKMTAHGVLRDRTSLVAMVAWCVCLLGVSVFTKDPNSGAETLRGSLHLYSTAAACGSLPFAALLVGWRHRRHPQWRRWAWTSQGLAAASVPCVLPFVISFFVIRITHASGVSSVPTGLVERLMGGVDVAILVVLALWSHRASSRRLAIGRNG